MASTPPMATRLRAQRLPRTDRVRGAPEVCASESLASEYPSPTAAKVRGERVEVRTTGTPSPDRLPIAWCLASSLLPVACAAGGVGGRKAFLTNKANLEAGKSAASNAAAATCRAAGRRRLQKTKPFRGRLEQRVRSAECGVQERIVNCQLGSQSRESVPPKDLRILRRSRNVPIRSRTFRNFPFRSVSFRSFRLCSAGLRCCPARSGRLRSRDSASRRRFKSMLCPSCSLRSRSSRPRTGNALCCKDLRISGRSRNVPFRSETFRNFPFLSVSFRSVPPGSGGFRRGSDRSTPLGGTSCGWP